MLSSLANNLTTIVRGNYSFVAIGKSVINFSAALGKEHGVSFFAAWMVNIVKHAVLFDFLFHNSPQIYQRYMRVGKVFLQSPTFSHTIMDIDGVYNGSRSLCISNSDDETLSSS